MPAESAFAHTLVVDHVVFFVDDAERAAARTVAEYGLGVLDQPAGALDEHSVAVGGGDIRLVFTEALTGDHPAAAYVAAHGDGVADIALGVDDTRAAYDEAVRRGARSVAAPVERDGTVVATIMGFGDVTHTFVQRDGDEHARPAVVVGDPPLATLDHFAVCVGVGELAPTVEFYETVLGFRVVFEERIVVGAQAMDSKVVQSASGAVTLTLIEPDTSRAPGQIDRFLKAHDGAGVQHIALTTPDIVDSVRRLRDRGVAFLNTPGAYYDRLGTRIETTRDSVTDLREQNILVDEDHHGQLYQIFARSTHPRGTFFFEIIERMGARTFGSGNIKALYEAVEADGDPVSR